MLSKTTVSALRALIYLARRQDQACLSPRRIGEALGESPTYLAKSLRHLVKTGILRAEKGVHGGVRLGRQPASVTLLAIVEACQGEIAGDSCQASWPSCSCCGFHLAALDLHNAITGVLSRWTLDQFIAIPAGGEAVQAPDCLMRPGQPS
jgi:Rrf2 family nitric oxide-sensitive transcriptional repressor